MSMLFDFLYPALWIGIGAVGLGLVARRWERQARLALDKAQANSDQKAEQLKSRLTQIEAALTERLALAQASASASDAQLRSQLALRDSEREAAHTQQTRQSLDQLTQQFAQVEQAALERHAQLGLQMAQFITESNSRAALHFQQLEAALFERLAKAQAASSASGAQLRGQLAQRDSELEAASALQMRRFLDRMAQLHAESKSEIGVQTQQLEKALSERLAQEQARASESDAHLSQLLSEQAALLADSALATDRRRRLDRLQNDLDFVKNHMSSYLGGGTGLTHLVDETPIYINTNDFGCPSNFINGGRYEEEYYQVLASFRKPDSVFLDIGANLGVFSLRLAPLLRNGHIYAFEPNSQIHELFSRSIHLNGLKDRVTLLRLGASDQNAQLALNVPEGHAGGASVSPFGEGHTGPTIEVRRIDDVLAELPQFDLAKIDVEGHELHALRGMDKLLSRSPEAVILFEKLNANSGIEEPLIELFTKYEMVVYRIDGVTLLEVNLEQFSLAQAYFLAARPAVVGDELCRNFINVFPNDLYATGCRVIDGALIANIEMPANCLIFHGPYWYLPRGSYNLSLTGEIEESFKLFVAEKFGYVIAEFSVSQGRQNFAFVVENDLTQFELIGRAGQEPVKFSITGIRLTRLG